MGHLIARGAEVQFRSHSFFFFFLGEHVLSILHTMPGSVFFVWREFFATYLFYGFFFFLHHLSFLTCANATAAAATMSSSSYPTTQEASPAKPPKPTATATTTSADNETLLATQQMKTAYTPLPQQQQACLHEVHEVVHGRQAFLTTTPENPATARRPPARDLEERGLLKPGLARATQAASLEKPWGSPPDGPNYQKMGTNLRTVMQQHVDFFDRDSDGVITMLDTFLGFRRLGFNWVFSLWAVFVVNPAFSLMSSPGWLPDPLLRVYSRNIHRGKHGSDQEVYDPEGRFIPQKFEDLFTKYVRIIYTYKVAQI